MGGVAGVRTAAPGPGHTRAGGSRRPGASTLAGAGALRSTAATCLFHDGGTGGFRSFAGIAPERGACAVVLASQARPVGRLGLRVLGALIHRVSAD